MIVQIFENEKQVAKACATLIAAEVTKNPACVLGLATGSSPIETYKKLIKWHQKGTLDFSRCTSFNLDEYVGIEETNPLSYHRFMKDNLFDHTNFKASYVPDGNAENMAKAAAEYDQSIREHGGIDLQLLGIGRNGHIGFNEPDSVFSKGTGVVTLTQSTIEANRRFFEKEEDVPRTAVSMGIATIMSAKTIVLIAMGKDKQEAVYGMVKGDITPRLPASVLQLHKDVIVLCDKEAAALL